MKRLLLGSLMSCLFFGQVSAGYKAVINGALFSVGCSLLGQEVAKRIAPSSANIEMYGAAAGLLASGLLVWGAAKIEANAAANHNQLYELSDEAQDFRKGQAAAAVCIGVRALLDRGTSKMTILEGIWDVWASY